MRHRRLGKMGLRCGGKMGLRCDEEVREREKERKKVSPNFQTKLLLLLF